MKVLIDTNVIIDYLAFREPYYQNADKIFLLSSNQEIESFIAAHSIMNAFYILRSDFSSNERRRMLLHIFNVASVVGIDGHKIKDSLENLDFKDVEDCLQTECAIECNAEYIITRNVKDFEQSEIPPITPEDFLQVYNAAKQ